MLKFKRLKTRESVSGARLKKKEMTPLSSRQKVIARRILRNGGILGLSASVINEELALVLSGRRPAKRGARSRRDIASVEGRSGDNTATLHRLR